MAVADAVVGSSDSAGMRPACVWRSSEVNRMRRRSSSRDFPRFNIPSEAIPKRHPLRSVGRDMRWLAVENWTPEFLHQTTAVPADPASLSKIAIPPLLVHAMLFNCRVLMRVGAMQLRGGREEEIDSLFGAGGRAGCGMIAVVMGNRSAGRGWGFGQSSAI